MTNTYGLAIKTAFTLKEENTMVHEYTHIQSISNNVFQRLDLSISNGL
jgi:6-pyruvoyl-tetrahydropterin synthase